MTDAGPAAGRRPPGPTLAKGIGAGLCLAGSVPPWGWWPLAFVGIALLDRLIAERPTRSRLLRSGLVAAAWLYPATLWMWDLTAPGYVAAGAIFSAYYALAGALTPPGPVRRLVLPGAVALAEALRWSWPFGGVPLAHLALSQVTTPLGWSARIGGSLLVVVLVVVGGQALSAAVAGERRPAAIGLAVVVAFCAAGWLHPRAEVVNEADVALIQGGGPQRTRASAAQEPIVLARHLEATGTVEAPVDLVIWPENVVNPGTYLSLDHAYGRVAAAAADQQAPILAGWFYGISETQTVNYHSIVNPDGSETDRYDKVRIVPFGEYVPLRGLITRLAPDAGLPRRDVEPGTAEPVLDTPSGPVGVSISWEGFFDTRARASVAAGAELLINPTNGASYWLTQVQTQQVASNRLRALENDRWVLQVAPTGLSAIIDPDGNVLQQTGISERAVLEDRVEFRRGRTLGTIVGRWPVVAYGLVAVLAGTVLQRSGPRRARTISDGSGPDQGLASASA